MIHLTHTVPYRCAAAVIWNIASLAMHYESPVGVAIIA